MSTSTFSAPITPATRVMSLMVWEAEGSFSSEQLRKAARRPAKSEVVMTASYPLSDRSNIDREPRVSKPVPRVGRRRKPSDPVSNRSVTR